MGLRSWLAIRPDPSTSELTRFSYLFILFKSTKTHIEAAREEEGVGE